LTSLIPRTIRDIYSTDRDEYDDIRYLIPRCTLMSVEAEVRQQISG